MATGSKFGKSVMEASDAIYDFVCSPCADDGNNTEALFQCTVCKMLYCRRCVETHNKFTKDHNVLNKSSAKFGQFPKQTAMPVSSELPTDVCEEHHGEVIKMYCGHHDVVCCSICIAVKHRLCEGVAYIPNITKGLLKRDDKKKAKESLENMKDDFNKIKTKIQDELKLLNQQRDAMIDDIHKLKRRFIARVEQIEKQSLKDVKEKHIELTREITDNGKKIDDILEEVDLRLDKLKTSMNDAQTFVDINTANKTTMLGNDYAKKCRQRNAKHMAFEMNKKIEDCINEWTSFGRIKVSGPLHVNILRAPCDTQSDVTTKFISVLREKQRKSSMIESDCIQPEDIVADLYTIVVFDNEIVGKSRAVEKIASKHDDVLILIYLKSACTPCLEEAYTVTRNFKASLQVNYLNLPILNTGISFAEWQQEYETIAKLVKDGIST